MPAACEVCSNCGACNRGTDDAFTFFKVDLGTPAINMGKTMQNVLNRARVENAEDGQFNITTESGMVFSGRKEGTQVSGLVINTLADIKPNGQYDSAPTLSIVDIASGKVDVNAVSEKDIALAIESRSSEIISPNLASSKDVPVQLLTQTDIPSTTSELTPRHGSEISIPSAPKTEVGLIAKTASFIYTDLKRQADAIISSGAAEIAPKEITQHSSNAVMVQPVALEDPSPIAQKNVQPHTKSVKQVIAGTNKEAAAVVKDKAVAHRVRTQPTRIPFTVVKIEQFRVDGGNTRGEQIDLSTQSLNENLAVLPQDQKIIRDNMYINEIKRKPDDEIKEKNMVVIFTPFIANNTTKKNSQPVSSLHEAPQQPSPQNVIAQRLTVMDQRVIAVKRNNDGIIIGEAVSKKNERKEAEEAGSMQPIATRDELMEVVTAVRRIVMSERQTKNVEISKSLPSFEIRKPPLRIIVSPELFTSIQTNLNLNISLSLQMNDESEKTYVSNNRAKTEEKDDSSNRYIILATREQEITISLATLIEFLQEQNETSAGFKVEREKDNTEKSQPTTTIEELLKTLISLSEIIEDIPARKNTSIETSSEISSSPELSQITIMVSQETLTFIGEITSECKKTRVHLGEENTDGVTKHKQFVTFTTGEEERTVDGKTLKKIETLLKELKFQLYVLAFLSVIKELQQTQLLYHYQYIQYIQQDFSAPEHLAKNTFPFQIFISDPLILWFIFQLWLVVSTTDIISERFYQTDKV